MKVTKDDIENLTKTQLKKIIDDVKNVLGLKTTGKTKDELVNSLYDIHNNNKFNNKKLFGFDANSLIILPERKTENRKLKKKLKEEAKEKQEAKIKKEKEAKNKEIKNRLKKVTAERIKKAEIARATTVYLESVREAREAQQKLDEINRRIALRKKK